MLVVDDTAPSDELFAAIHGAVEKGLDKTIRPYLAAVVMPAILWGWGSPLEGDARPGGFGYATDHALHSAYQVMRTRERERFA